MIETRYPVSGGDTLAYDCEGNLACVSNAVSGAVSFYWYDQHGRRVAKSEAGLLTLYIWDGMDIIATASADGTIREYFTRGIGIAGDVGSLIAETRFSGGTATTTYLHSNWRGDVVMATDTSGNVVGEYAYTTFGEQLSSVGDFVPRFTFSSKERDASGLVYHGFRYYCPVLCRWLNEDPIRESGGLNLYQFCWNDPVNRVDPWGDNPIKEVVDYLSDAITEPLNNFARNVRNAIGLARNKILGEPERDPNMTDCMTQAPPDTFSRDDITSALTLLASMKLGPPARELGYKPPKNWNGKLVKNPNGPGSGYPAKDGKVWVPTTHKGTHAPHYDVQDPKTGGHVPVYTP